MFLTGRLDQQLWYIIYNSIIIILLILYMVPYKIMYCSKKKKSQTTWCLLLPYLLWALNYYYYWVKLKFLSQKIHKLPMRERSFDDGSLKWNVFPIAVNKCGLLMSSAQPIIITALEQKLDTLEIFTFVFQLNFLLAHHRRFNTLPHQ